MSRIGKKPVSLPDGVSIKIQKGQVTITGPKGTLDFAIPFGIGVKEENNILNVFIDKPGKNTKKLWGTVRALLANMVVGVTQGYEKKLEVEGVGYKATVSGKDLEMLLGFSHPVRIKPPEGIEFKVEKNTITVSGISKEEVGRIASTIRSIKKPEPYKGKGIHYVGESIRRKAGKKAMTTG